MHFDKCKLKYFLMYVQNFVAKGWLLLWNWNLNLKRLLGCEIVMVTIIIMALCYRINDIDNVDRSDGGEVHGGYSSALVRSG